MLLNVCLLIFLIFIIILHEIIINPAIDIKLLFFSFLFFSALNSLGLILQHLGNLAPELLPWLLKVLLVITSTSMTLLEKRDEVLPWCINLLKSVRTLAVMKLIQFFKMFPKYEFTPDEIDAIFESIVWPMLPRLELESVKMPSPLLRLFCAWSENQRYFVLFSKYHKDCKSLTVLPHLIALYTSSRVKPRVVGVVSKIIFHLILSKSAAVTEEKEEEENVVPLKINFSLCDPEDLMAEVGSITYGMKLLLPFVDNILQRLESTFFILNKKRSRKALSQRDLTILLGISPHVENSEQCYKLIHLLVPFLHNPKTDVDPQVFILNTISNLIKKVKNVECFMELFAPLFGKLTNQNSRTAVTSIFTTMAEENKKLAEMAIVINKVLTILFIFCCIVFTFLAFFSLLL